jgi:hypothetical protein
VHDGALRRAADFRFPRTQARPGPRCRRRRAACPSPGRSRRRSLVAPPASAVRARPGVLAMGLRAPGSLSPVLARPGLNHAERLAGLRAGEGPTGQTRRVALAIHGLRYRSP